MAEVAIGTAPPQVRVSLRRLRDERQAAAILIAFLALVLVVIIALPLWTLLSKSFQDANGGFVGLRNFAIYFSTPTLFASLLNSVAVAALSTAIVVPLAFIYAYGLTRSCMPGKGLFYAAALLPIYAPIGIVIAEVLYSFPHALLILVTALALSDGRLYEVAAALGTTPARVFRTITLPGARYGLISACFVVFTLVVTDFGIPKVIGGQFNVLATDAYKQVVGQQNFPMGAVVGMILLVPAVLAFAVDRLVQRKQLALLSSLAVPYQAKPARGRDLALLIYAASVGGLIVATYGMAVWASFITYWPYNLSLTLNNYVFANAEPTGWGSYFNSLAMAALAAGIGTALVFTGAYLIEKLKIFPAGRAFAHLLAMLPMAVPGLVLGLGYVFFFNAPWNPLNVFYGTLTVLVVNTIAHFYTVAHITATTALKQIDAEFEAVSASLKVPFWRTFGRVTVPICMPAILDIAVYMFVNALTTVSSVIFLYGAGTKLASIAIVHMDESGTIAAAAAMATVIMATAIGAKVAHLVLNRLVFERLQAWRKR